MIRKVLKWSLLLLVLLLAGGFAIAYVTSTNECGRTAVPPGEGITAVIHCDYGLSNVKLEEIAKPAPKNDEVLVRVRAAALNPYDWHFVEGTPYVMRALGVGLRKPRSIRLGVDFAGVVESAGKDVSDYKSGDEVFGGANGAFAEYLCRRATGSIARKPANVSFEQAASLNIAGITALQGVRDKGKVHAGEKVLINGASGGVGTFAVQIAKSFGAHVTGVCSTRNLELVRSLGADETIDYTKEDFTKGNARYDVILDNVGVGHSLPEYRGVLEPNGRYVLIGGGGVQDQGFLGGLARALWAPIYSKFAKKQMGMMMADSTSNDLTLLAGMVANGKLKPVIDRTYELAEVKQAFAYLEQGHARGKIILRVQ
jgi:NADPH:quinone reductase-like Zn-dependent oxidoreductase